MSDIKPQIIAPEYGRHNEIIEESIARLNTEGMYKDLSTIQLIPSFGQVPTKAVASWMNMITPPNGKFYRIWCLGMEVGEAFSQTIENILAHPELSKYKYLLTVEHDNVIPPDGLVKLLTRMENNKEYAAIGGLYWTKGPGGHPQIWGDVKDSIPNYRPQPPDPNGGLVECWGTGMGFTLFRMDMFKDSRFTKPLFKTKASVEEGVGTQDLAFWGKAREFGYRCAIDCSVLVGHYDLEGKFGDPDTTW
jgi:hypothetical protein